MTFYSFYIVYALCHRSDKPFFLCEQSGLPYLKTKRNVEWLNDIN